MVHLNSRLSASLTYPKDRSGIGCAASLPGRAIVKPDRPRLRHHESLLKTLGPRCRHIPAPRLCLPRLAKNQSAPGKDALVSSFANTSPAPLLPLQQTRLQGTYPTKNRHFAVIFPTTSPQFAVNFRTTFYRFLARTLAKCRRQAIQGRFLQHSALAQLFALWFFPSNLRCPLCFCVSSSHPI